MKFRSLAVVGALLAAALVPAVGVSAASATEYGGEVCTPTEAWTEYIEHPAEGEPTLIVPNPEYQPPVEEVSHIVHHPEVTEVVHHPEETEVVHHEAVTHTEYHFAKFTRERTREKGSRGWNDWTGYGEWSKYSPETHTSWQLGTNPIGSPQFHSSGNYGPHKQWERQWQALHDGQTRVIVDKAAWEETVVTKEAWEETVVITEAWEEKIIDVPGKPAVGEPTKSVPNPDYVEAWTETINHPEVTCPTGPAHSANGEATCGAWSITLYNEQADGYENQTASYVVYIDGEFSSAYAVPADGQETVTGTFPEDSGNHQVIVRSGPAQGDEVVFSLDVASDCILPQPEDEVTEQVVTPLIPCDAVEGDEIETTATVTTTPYVLVDGQWVAGEPVVTTKDAVYVVTAADAEAAECPVVVPPKPEPVVVIDVNTPLIPCDAEVGDEINTTATITTTDYVLVDNVWVPGEPRVTNIAAPYVVTAEDVEGLECPVVVPPKPEDKVTVGEWPKPSINCMAEVGDSIAISREVTTTPYILVDNVWVLDTANAVVTYEEDIYTVTAEDIEALNCPVVEPPVVEPPVVKPPVVEPPVVEPPAPKPAVVKVVKAAAKEDDSILAQTGGEIAGWTIGGALAALLIGGLLIARRRQA